MRLDEPRVQPTTEDDWDEDTRALLLRSAENTGGRVLNLMSTIARHPTLLHQWMPFGRHVLGTSTLPIRERELVILRTAVNAGSEYEWVQHVAIGRRFGCTDDDVERVAIGPDAPGWTDAEWALLAATDELMFDDFVCDATWAALREHWSEVHCIDLVFTVGQYRLIAMALNTFGVQLEEGVERLHVGLFAGSGFGGGSTT